MSTVLLSVVLLAAIFVLASWRNVNIGTLAFPAALLVGSVAGLSTDDLLSSFPAELFVVVVGITYLFGIAQSNGTIDWILEVGVRLLRGRVAFLPMLTFLLAFTITAIGAVGTATMAMTLPIAMACAYRYKISPFLIAMTTTCGMQAGFFSPSAVYSATVVQIIENAGLSVSRLGLFAAHALLNVGIAVVVYLVFGGLKLLRRSVTASATMAVAVPAGTGGAGSVAVGTGPDEDPADSGDGTAVSEEERPERPDGRTVAFRWATLAALVALIAGVLVFDLNPGLLALSLGAVLMLAFASGEDKHFVTKISWPAVLMITGVLTFIGVMQATGALDAVTNALERMGASPSVSVMIIGYITAIVSAFASSIGTMGATVPMLLPLFEADPSLDVLNSVTAVTASTYLVDPSPLSILGVLILANARQDDQKSLFRKLVVWALVMALVAPAVLWTVLVVLPG